MNLLTLQAKVVNLLQDAGKSIIILDQTVFYPQGGGQPYDQGTIVGPLGRFSVEEVRFVDGMVKHIGTIVLGTFSPGEIVQCTVDKDRRTLHSRIHSAGHVVDMAVHALHLSWVPGKGYHFPQGPYIEYEGRLEGADKERLKNEIEPWCNRFIEENRKTIVHFMEKEQMAKVCHFVPEYLPEGKPARVVMYGDFGVPCGGTHVGQLGEIRRMTIRKIKPEGSTLRVSYEVEK